MSFLRLDTATQPCPWVFADGAMMEPSSPSAHRRPLVDSVARAGNKLLNSVTVPVLDSRWSWVLRPFIATITYRGRRSGSTFSTPVLYVKRGDTLTIHVTAPVSKQWWRNFMDEGGPIAVQLRQGTRTGHAISRRNPRGGVNVTVLLDPPQRGAPN